MGSNPVREKIHFYITLVLFVGLVIWWLFVQYLRVTGSSSFDMAGQAFAAVYGIVALWGGCVTLVVSRKWGLLSSLFGRSLFSFSVGLFLQEFGQLAYSYYISLKIDIPYPSLGDVGYFGSIFFYIYGAYLLMKLLSISTKGRGLLDKVLMVLAPSALLAVSYLLFLKDHEFTPGFSLVNFLDIGYPLLQCVYVSLAFRSLVFLGSKFGGTMMRGVLMILVALISQYVSDFVFLFKASRGTYVAGGITDFLYLLSYFLLTIAIIELDLVFMRLKNGKISNGNGGAFN